MDGFPPPPCCCPAALANGFGSVLPPPDSCRSDGMSGGRTAGCEPDPLTGSSTVDSAGGSPPDRAGSGEVGVCATAPVVPACAVRCPGTGPGVVEAGDGTGAAGFGTGVVAAGDGTGVAGFGTGVADCGTGPGVVAAGDGTGVADCGTGEAACCGTTGGAGSTVGGSWTAALADRSLLSTMDGSRPGASCVDGSAGCCPPGPSPG